MRITCPTLKYWFNDIFYIKGLNSSNFLCWEREKYCKIATTTEFLHLQIYFFLSDKYTHLLAHIHCWQKLIRIMEMLTKDYQDITFLDFDKTDYTWYWIPIIYRWSYLNPPPRGLLPNPPPCLIGCPNPPRPRPEIYQSLINDYIHTWHSKYIFKVTWHELFSLFWWFL